MTIDRFRQRIRRTLPMSSWWWYGMLGALYLGPPDKR